MKFILSFLKKILLASYTIYYSFFIRYIMKKLVKLLSTISATFVALFFLSSCEDNSSKSDKLINIEGYVINQNGELINGAVVKIYNTENVYARDTTNELGNFSLIGIPETATSLRIAANASGYSFYDISYIAAKSIMKDGKLPIMLMKEDLCCNAVHIIVKDSKTNESIKNAQVKLAKLKTDWKIYSNTNADGIAIFDSICEGSYWIRVAIDGYVVKEEDLQLDSCITRTIELKMDKIEKDSCCTSKVKIWVKDQSNEIIKNATVKLWKNGVKIDSRVTENGYAVFEGLCKGNYGFSISADHYKGQEFDYEISCDEFKEFTKNLIKDQDSCCNGKIYIGLKSPNGELIKNATVKLWKNGVKIAYKTSENGYVTFSELCEGNYGISITADHFKPYEFDFEIACNESKEIAKTLEYDEKDTCYSASLKIFAKDVDNKTVLSGAKVIIKLDGVVIYEGTTNDDGYIKKEPLKAPANYLIIVSKESYDIKQFEMKLTDCKAYQETASLKKQ